MDTCRFLNIATIKFQFRNKTKKARVKNCLDKRTLPFLLGVLMRKISVKWFLKLDIIKN
jgi:hypothetical protein